MRRFVARVAALLALLAGPAHADDVTFAVSELWIESGGERHHFRVELAETGAQQARGLMFRRELAADAGMLFLYEPPQHVSMWMKNTLIPLDMVFITAAGAIHRVASWAAPLSLTAIHSGAPVTAVLELPGGTADRLGLRAGDRGVHPHFGS